MSYLINTRQKSESALRKQNLGKNENLQNEMYPAVIVAVNGDGYDVATIDASGNMGATYERIFPHPLSATLAEGDDCWLWFPSNSDDPVIMVAGSGGASGCDVSPFLLGTLTLV